MAYLKGKSGNFTFTDGYLTWQINWSETYDIATNTSIVQIDSINIKSTAMLGTWHPSGIVKINGETVATMNYYAPATHKVTIGSANTYYGIIAQNSGEALPWKSKSIAHNSDGSASITISVVANPAGHNLPSIQLYRSSDGNTRTFGSSQSSTVSLTDIPRYATITNAPNFTDEENPTINYSNPAGSAVSSLMACISLDGSTADVAYRDIGKNGTSYTFNLTDAERTMLRNATRTSNAKAVHFIVRTVLGGDVYTSSQVKTLHIINANPTFTASHISYADRNTAVVAITGNNQHIVQNKSSMVATINTAATANKGANITQYTVSLNEVTKTVTGIGDISFGTINSSQDVTLTITAKDSRGNETTVKKTVTVLAWSPPFFTASIERLNNYEDETYLTVDASISSVNGTNDMTITYVVMQSGGEYSEPEEIENKHQYTIECDKNYVHTFSITVVDSFGGSITKEFTLPKGKFPLFIDTEKNAVGINEFPQDGETLRVAGGKAVFEEGIQIGGRTVVDFVIEQGTESMGTDGTWIWSKWASGKAECYGVRNYGDITVSTAWGTLYYSAVFSQPFPGGLFDSAPTYVNVNFAHAANATGQVWKVGGNDLTATETGKFQIVRATSYTLEQVHISFYAIGKWK